MAKPAAKTSPPRVCIPATAAKTSMEEFIPESPEDRMLVNISTIEAIVPSAPSVLIAVPIIIVHQAPFRSSRIAITPIHWAIKATKAGRTPINPKNELLMTHETQPREPGQSASIQPVK